MAYYSGIENIYHEGILWKNVSWKVKGCLPLNSNVHLQHLKSDDLFNEQGTIYRSIIKHPPLHQQGVFPHSD